MIVEKEYDIILTTLEPNRVGGPQRPLSGAENPVAKVANRFTIPGSSLKGKLRSEIERYLIDKYYHNGGWEAGKEMMQPCIASAKLSPDEKALVGVGKYRDETGSCRYPCKGKDRNGKRYPICPACYFLGAMSLSGFVRVPFLFTDIPSEKLYSSSMDRAKGTGKEGMNRPYELIADGVQFKGTLSVIFSDTVLNWELGKPRPLNEEPILGDQWLKDGSPYANKSADELIKEFIIDRLEGITIIGGYKSKGFGKVKVMVRKKTGE